ncbi:MAG: dTDP-3-amino-3,6-dideoxy-alpha-D-galactopyranose 3-N-acetyltransferase [Syntrophomonadaceae bacterium]|nr:dTDP-3-amino-3,6-dideoxy-alpha-D-galactopyranose 3-N-acetyltransferase [Bacillota bacterium]
MYKQSKISKRVIFYGKVDIGKGTIVGDNVVLGHKEDGKLCIGENSIIRSGTIIYSEVRIGSNFRSGHNVLIRENTEIGNDVLIGTNSVIDGDCIIGSSVSIQTGVYVTRNTMIEDCVFLGPFCVTTNDKYMERGAELIGPTIKKGAKVGANSTLLPGIIIGENSVIGAGAVVIKNVAPGDIIVGNPARSIKSV